MAVYATDPGPQLPFDNKSFFKGLFGPISTDLSSGVRHLPLGGRSEDSLLETNSLVLRPCYDHFLPHIHNPMYGGSSFRYAVTGTPGVGKTVFGAYLLRHFLMGSDNNNDGEPLCFDTFHYIFGSGEILDLFHHRMLNQSDELLNLCQEG